MRTIRFPLDAWQENGRVFVECSDSAVYELRDCFQRRADETKTLVDNAARQGRHDAGLEQSFAAAVHGLNAVDEALGVASRG